MALRLCLVSELFHPVYSGAAVRFARYLPGLEERGIQVSVFTGTPGRARGKGAGAREAWSGYETGALLPPEVHQGVPIQRVRLPEDGGARRAFVFSRSFTRWCEESDIDVVQFLSAHLTSIPSLLTLRLRGVPMVYTRTIMLPRVPKIQVLRRAWIKAKVSFPLGFMDRVVVSSEVMRQDLERIGVTVPMVTIPHGVDLRLFRPPESGEERVCTRSELGLPRGVPVVLFVGSIEHRKGVDLLLEAWIHLARRWPRLQLVLVGPREAPDPANRSFHEQIDSLLDRSGARQRVHLAGLVDNVEEYMRAADVFLFTSRREGFPNVVGEAMASGLPVVTTPFVGLPDEFGTPGREYVLSTFDGRELADDVSRLLSDRRERRRLGHAARRCVERGLPVSDSVDAYADLYREVACDS